MMAATKLLTRLVHDERGAMLVETAIVAPVLILLSLGSFQISQLVARQTELQGAASDALGIALTAPPETSQQRQVLKNVIVSSTGLASNQVTITEKFRCGTATSYVNQSSDCVGTKVAQYVEIQLTDTYTPAWVNWGLARRSTTTSTAM